MPNPFESALTLKALAREQGFDLAGISRAQSSPHADAYRNWLAANKHGSMDYLAKNLDHRLDITQKFPWAKSILSVAIAYWQPPQSSRHFPSAVGSVSSPPPVIISDAAPDPTGKIARYAWGRDYHKVIEAKLKRLEKRLHETFAPTPPVSPNVSPADTNASPSEPPGNSATPTSEAAAEKLQTRIYCDTGPLLEREMAARAGLGWIGKHTLLLHPRHGSWFLLGELVTSLELEPDSPLADHCGTCRRCIEACPTAAITPYSVDATRCISYQTLENRATTIPAEFHAPMQEANFLLGCDICQEVCPFNRHPLETSEPDFTPRLPAPEIRLQTVLQMQDAQWDQLTRGSATRRAKLPMWQRNAQALQPHKPPASIGDQ